VPPVKTTGEPISVNSLRRKKETLEVAGLFPLLELDESVAEAIEA